MGTFYTSCVLEHPQDRGKSQDIPKLLVDTGSEATWVAADLLGRLGIRREKEQPVVMANGQRISCGIGYAIIHVGTYATIDEVVFAEPGDLSILGARTLEGLNLTIDVRCKQLIEAGPPPAAGAGQRV